LINFCLTLNTYAQERQEYYIEIKDGVNLGAVSTTPNPDETVTISTANQNFSTFINGKQPYSFKRAFPTSITPILQRVYSVSFESNIGLTDFAQRSDIENMVPVELPQLIDIASQPPTITPAELTALPTFYPNDYTELIFEGLPNTALELIKAPLAWTITQGNPNVYVGVVDGGTDVNHEDLQGQIVMNLDDSPYPLNHGTAVASLVAAKTNNGKGMASIGFNTKLVTADAWGANRALEVSQIPGVKVVNCSFGGTSYNPYHDTLYQEIADSGVLVVAAAANGAEETYYYPASYDSTLSVTTVGARYPIGYYHDLGAELWPRSWKDCHYFRPDTGTGSHNVHNDKVDVCSPNMGIMSAAYSPIRNNLYTSQTNTSSATPIVSGLAGLIYGINPNFTAQQVKDIIKSTADDIYHIPYNQPLLGKLGTGRINAYRAVKTAKCMVDYTPGIDLAMQNSDIDDFSEPDTDTDVPWNSKDIWVRNNNDGDLIAVHQNPEYSPTNPNYVYVQVTNNSCDVSSGNDTLKLYWSKANTALAWPQHWDGSLFVTDPVTGQQVLMGDEVGELTIPSLEIGETAVLEFEWNVPNPENYTNINYNPWHFCLLARIESQDDPMTFTEGSFITDNVTNNNNIAWKNMSVVDIEPNLTAAKVTTAVAVGNPTNQTKNYNLELFKQYNEVGKNIYEEAEITITLDAIALDAWDDGGNLSEHFTATGQNNKLVVQDNEAKLNNLQLAPNQIATISLSFNFLTKEVTDKKKYVYHLVQRDVVTNEIIGGETFEIRKKYQNNFSADAGGDEEIERNETVTITATEINEEATYNWYDATGNLIYTGTALSISPEITETYKLEVISGLDGFKDYDEVTVTVHPYHIENISPNPAASQVNVAYEIDGANSAYLMLVNLNSGNSENFILDVTTDITTLDISSLPTGLYTLILVCDGVIQDSQNLIKE
jgi:subtilisin family serine protease